MIYGEEVSVMLTLLICIAAIWFFGKLVWFGIRASWGMLKMVVTIVFALGAVALMVYLGFFIIVLVFLGGGWLLMRFREMRI